MADNIIIIQADKILKAGHVREGVRDAVSILEKEANVVVVDVSDEQLRELYAEKMIINTIHVTVDMFLEDLKMNPETKDAEIIVIGKPRYETSALVVSSIDWVAFSKRHNRWLNSVLGLRTEATA